MKVVRSGIVLSSDASRVILRPLNPVGNERQLRIIARVLSLEESEVTELLEGLLRDFSGRHRDLVSFFQLRFDAVRWLLPSDGDLSRNRCLLIGAYFSQEFSLEAAALFNPSIVAHPDQNGVSEGDLRFVLSLRATGEGHISSVVFRSGQIDSRGEIRIDAPTRFASLPREVRHTIDKGLFTRKLEELGILQGAAESLVGVLPDSFSVDQLSLAISNLPRSPGHRTSDYDRVLSRILALAQANYEVLYTPDQPLSERVLFPTAPLESHGMEDARFVRFVDDDGRIVYYATYTAYDGSSVVPQMIRTPDFQTFHVSTLNGPEVQNKGLALFPRRIRGQYAMISRQDAENLYLMFSEDINFWYSRIPLLKPTNAWEFVQIGNCGSPIETPEGWLVLSHGVGAMRRYSLGAFLLDLDNPTRVIGRLKEPFLVPDEKEREGYVPNVLYSCGAIAHNGRLILPYAMSDSSCSFASVDLSDLTDAMKKT